MQKSILKNVYLFINGVVLYLLKRQQIVTQSIIDAKYYALAKVISKAFWLK